MLHISSKFTFQNVGDSHEHSGDVELNCCLVRVLMWTANSSVAMYMGTILS